MSSTRLRIQNFAHIADASLELGDLTVLVGAQGTGKSLALQWLKAALDGKQIVRALQGAGQQPTEKNIIDLIFGVGMNPAWTDQTEVSLNGKAVTRKSISRRGDGNESVFFIPAHRASLIGDGWAAQFQRISTDTPVVARMFSQNLFDLFSDRTSSALFPRERTLKEVYRKLIDDAVFHHGEVGLEEDQQHNKRLRLTHGESKLPFMTWTAGQREFTPLLLGLYHLLPSRKIPKQKAIDWVVIEEPEMGLHPQAVTAFLLLVLDLVWRGYRVVLTTHSPVVLTMMWALRVLRERKARWQLVCSAFGVSPSQQLKPVAEAILASRCSLRTYVMEFAQPGRVHAKDISHLDPAAEDDAESGWGGLTAFTSNFTNAVRAAVSESEVGE